MNPRPGRVAVKPGPIDRLLSPSEIGAWIDRWFEAFSADLTGIYADDYIWHVFSYERYPSSSKAEARAAYKRQVAPEYVVISNDRDMGFITKSRPTTCSLRDWLVFPPNLAWTMAFTHEDDSLGPYFAKQAEYTSLDQANRKALMKAREAGRPKRSG